MQVGLLQDIKIESKCRMRTEENLDEISARLVHFPTPWTGNGSFKIVNTDCH